MKPTNGRRIGPRMVELCGILARMGGRAPAMRRVYMRLAYPQGGASNRYGSAAMNRAMAAGLIAVGGKYRPGHPVPVRLTDAGWRVARGA